MCFIQNLREADRKIVPVLCVHDDICVRSSLLFHPQAYKWCKWKFIRRISF